MSEPTATCEFYRDASGWHWRLKSPAGRVVACSAEPRASRRSVRQSWTRVQDLFAMYIREKDACA